MTSPETAELEAVDAALAGRYVAPEHAELAELALLLRDDRPEPTPAWPTQLDRRVEAGFPARPTQAAALRPGSRNVGAGLALRAVIAADRADRDWRLRPAADRRLATAAAAVERRPSSSVAGGRGGRRRRRSRPRRTALRDSQRARPASPRLRLGRATGAASSARPS